MELLLQYLQEAREALLWKLEGLSEYDIRRPLTPTGTNLLGLVKHVAGVEHEYFTDCLGQSRAFDAPWLADDTPDNSDMWATDDESREFIVDLYRTAWKSDDAIVRELGLEATGVVPWWKNKETTVRRLLIHMIAETHRHAGHADILRELIDGAVGLRPTVTNIPAQEREWWIEYVETLEKAAREAEAASKLEP
ncbi:DinB family protein [Leucobacter denitrificans]|uniref:DinB family protein n=1 Tax=Leucobacter denitrificans TaxID=683042 RepID=A0A7G9S7R4_9MICO|nr:DinB family protein [Leucobacter denitrificans]